MARGRIFAPGNLRITRFLPKPAPQPETSLDDPKPTPENLAGTPLCVAYSRELWLAMGRDESFRKENLLILIELSLAQGSSAPKLFRKIFCQR